MKNICTSLLFYMGIASGTAHAEEVQLKTMNLKIAVPKKCKLKNTPKGPQVKCTNPIVDVRYKEESYPVLVETFQLLQRDAKKMFTSPDMSVEKVSNVEIKPIKNNGEIQYFVLVLKNKDTLIAQIYTMMTLDKQKAFYAIQTYDAKTKEEEITPLLKKLMEVQAIQ